MAAASLLHSFAAWKDLEIPVNFSPDLTPAHTTYWDAETLATITGGTWLTAPPATWFCKGFVHNQFQLFPGAMLVHNAAKAPFFSPNVVGYMTQAPQAFAGSEVPVLCVENCDVALYRVAHAARNKFQGKVIAITGSAGKTSTVHALASTLAHFGNVEFSRGGGNVPRAIARTIASCALNLPYWVLELSMVNMQASSQLAKPDIAVVTSIYEAHLSDLKSLHGVARQKSLIFTAMQPGALAVLHRDMNEFDTVQKEAKKKQLTIVTYGKHEEADVRFLYHEHGITHINFMGEPLSFPCSLPPHAQQNTLAVLVCLHALGVPQQRALPHLTAVPALPGRGQVFPLTLANKQITVLDESYNANPGSITAALEHLNHLALPDGKAVVFLGDIADLGEQEVQIHLQLVPVLLAAKPDRLVLCGPLMHHVHKAIGDKIPGAWYPGVEELMNNALSWLEPNDFVLVKSSGHKLQDLVAMFVHEHNNRLQNNMQKNNQGVNMHFNDRLAHMRRYVAKKCHMLPHGSPACTLVFSVTDGHTRALVHHATGPTFRKAWEAGARTLQTLMKEQGIQGKHLRVDWVTSCLQSNWRQLNNLLEKVKRTYFRFGFALDAEFSHIFTEMECNANAVYYGGPSVAHCVFNAGNLAKYAKQRYNNFTMPLFTDTTPVWLIGTAGAYCDAKGAIVALPAALPKEYGLISRSLYCGKRDISQLTVPVLKDVVKRGAHWLASQIQDSGRFIYGYFPCFDKEIQAYNSLRHASSVYSLLDVIDFTNDRRHMPAIERCLAYMAQELVHQYEPIPGKHMAFLIDHSAKEAKLGGNGVALLALAKHASLTGSTQYRELMTHLAEGIIHMQDQNTGVFTHVLHSDTLAVKEPYRIIYYDGEAVFGLLRLYGVDNNLRWLHAAQKAFEVFLGSERHLTAHDHWLSYAANEISAAVPDKRYTAFGLKNCMEFLDFTMLRETTFPTLLELCMAAQKLIVREEQLWGKPLIATEEMDAFKKTLHYRAHFLLNGFFWPEVAMFFANPARCTNAFFIRHHAFRTRIDDAQHYLSGLAAYGMMLQQDQPQWASPKNPRSLGSRYSRVEKMVTEG